ncbi:hypothetical protein C2R73_00450, partial [Helicobacter pylori]
SATTQINAKETQAITNIEINTNKTASLEAIKEAKTSANNEINTNKTQAITNINEAKNTIIIKTLIFLRLNKAC